MKKNIALENTQVTYTLKKSRRARRLRLAVYCDGTIVVTTPFNLKETTVEKFIREKSDWLFTKLAFFKQFKGKALTRYSEQDYFEYKEKAYDLAVERIKYFNRTYKLHYNKINIKNQKTRWGSCSKKGNLNFNYKIALLPQRVADYIIVHELCHLQEFNHSQKFWTLVSKVMPDYLDVRNDLKKSGVNLS